jgi:ELWxxDGT repeat protein
MVRFAGQFWFVATDIGGSELWHTDGSSEGTQKLEVNPSDSIGSNPRDLTVVGDALYFVADGGDGAGTELWRTDGTARGTVRVSDAAPGSAAGVGEIGSYDGRVLYFFDASYETPQLWNTDGTLEGTRKVADICSAPECYPFAQFARVSN